MNRTFIYYTANLIPENFATNIRRELKKVADEFSVPIISVSQKPIVDFGLNICVGDIGVCNYNVYKQLYEGVKLATTDYVVCCEDDILYSNDHLFYTPPTNDIFYYNINRYNIDKAVFWHRPRVVMSMCISSRQLMFEAMDERFTKHPTKETPKWRYFSEPGKYERSLGVTIQTREHFETKVPNIIFNHRNNLGGRRKIYEAEVRLTEIPYWGEAQELWKRIYVE